WSRALGSAGLLAKRLGWVAGHGLPWGDVPRHHGPGADRCLAADSHAAEDRRAGADRGTVLDDGPQHLPLAGAEQTPLRAARARPLVVDEDDAVADEDAVADLHPVADEGVTLDLAAGADPGTRLDLDESPDLGAGADPAAVEVGERMDDDALAELD